MDMSGVPPHHSQQSGVSSNKQQQNSNNNVVQSPDSGLDDSPINSPELLPTNSISYHQVSGLTVYLSVYLSINSPELLPTNSISYHQVSLSNCLSICLSIYQLS